MTLVVNENNCNKIVELFLTKVSGCPDFFSVWDFLALYPKKIEVCVPALSGLIQTMVEADSNPGFNKTALECLSDSIVKLAKLQMKVGK